MQNSRKKIRIVVIAGLLLLVVIFFVRYSRETPVQQQSIVKKVHVVTSFYPLYFFASRIGGDQVEVLNITPAGAEPHDYEPTPKDVARIEASDLLVLNGGGLEAWGKNITQNLDQKKTRVVTVGEFLTTAVIKEDGKTVPDPHVWLSPLLAKKMVDRIAESFVAADPAEAPYFYDNAEKLKKDLDQLDVNFRERLSNCSTKDIVTAHAAFGYLADAYGLRQVPVAGLSPDAEPSPRQLAEVTAFMKQNQVKYIFFESLVSPKLSETIASEVGAKTLVLDPIEGLSNQALGRGEDYLSVMRNNLTNLQIALTCRNSTSQ